MLGKYLKGAAQGIVCLLIVGLLLAGCGGGGGGGATGGGTGGGGTSGSTLGNALTFTAKASGSQVQLNWSAVTGASSYNLYWSSSPSVSPSTGNKISGITALTYTHTGLTPDTTYYYCLTAVDSTGEGPATNTISATPPWSKGNLEDAEPFVGTSIYPDSVSANDLGTSVAVWEYNFSPDGSNYLYLNVAQSGVWGNWASAPFATYTKGAAVSAAPTGGAVLVYVQGSGVSPTTGLMTSSNIDAQIYNQGTNTWSAQQVIGGSSAPNTFVVLPSVAVDGNGNAMAIWEDATGNQMYASEYSPTSGSWGAATQISNPASAVNSINTQIVANGNNTFTAIWTQSDSAGVSPYVSQFSGGTWSAPVSIGFAPSSATSFNAAEVTAAASSNGNIVVVWKEEDQTSTTINYTMVGAEYNSGTATWSAATDLITPGTANAYFYPRVAADSKGNAQAVWESDATSVSTIATVWGARYTAGTGWAAAQELDKSNGDYDVYPAIGMESNGNAQLVYYDSSIGKGAVRAYDATSGSWQTINTKPLSGKLTYDPLFNMSPGGYGVLLGYDQNAGYYTTSTGYYCSLCMPVYTYTTMP